MKVIKIGAIWCNGCLVMRPRWQEIEKENPWLKTEYYDFDQNQTEINQYHVDSDVLPVFIFLDKNNQEFLRLTGEVDKARLIQLIDENRDK